MRTHLNTCDMDTDSNCVLANTHFFQKKRGKKNSAERSQPLDNGLTSFPETSRNKQTKKTLLTNKQHLREINDSVSFILGKDAHGQLTGAANSPLDSRRALGVFCFFLPSAALSRHQRRSRQTASTRAATRVCFLGLKGI